MRFKLTRPEIPEAALLSMVMQRLAYAREVAWHDRFNSGATLVGEGKARRFVRYNTMPEGLACPDILGQMRDGRLLAIEVKRLSGRTRPGQKEFIDLARGNGAVAGIVRSLEDLDALMKQKN